MPSYWLLSAGKDGELWPAFWTNHQIAIGWPALGNLTQYDSYETLKAEMRQQHPTEANRRCGQWVASVWNFYKEIQIGELVFIRSYASLLGIALVDGEYNYIEENDPLRRIFYSPFFACDYPHIRSVKWVSLGGGMKQPGTLNRLTIMSRPFRNVD